MKRTSDDAEKYEIRSAYSKIGPWLEENKGIINRKQKKGADGKMMDKKASLIPTVKAIIFQQSKIKDRVLRSECGAARAPCESWAHRGTLRIPS